MEFFDAYSHALTSVALIGLIIMAQNFHIGYLRGKLDLAPDGDVPQDYGSEVFRVFRVFANSVESAPPFIAAVVAAVLLGAPAFWINLLASLHVVCRLAYWYIYVRGIGKKAAGTRTFVFVGGWALNVLIGLLAIFAGLF